MKKTSISIGDTVVFKGSVISRCGHSENIVNFKAVIKELFGNLCLVENSDGGRWIPTANLAPIKAIYDTRLKRRVSLILDIQ